jgi:outer membrane protein TolC
MLIVTGIVLGQEPPVADNSNLIVASSARRLTLDEAQSLASGAANENPMIKLAQLNAQAAEYKRKQAQADYFPKINATFANMHFNKFMGQNLQIVNRSIGVPFVNKDFTLFASTITQPLTPLLKVRQAVKIMRADERIAKAKAAAASATIAANVENAYFELMITQSQRVAADAKIAELEKGLHLASVSTEPIPGIANSAAALLNATKTSVELKSRELALSASLNGLIGLREDTTLELVAPKTVINSQPLMTLGEATARATAIDPGVMEAEQNLVKAKAAKRLSQLEYVPDLAVVGGYTYQNAVPILPTDFTFVGVMATFNVFDFGKRENLVKERKTTLEMAQTALELAKGAAAAAVKTSYLEVDRTRQLLQLTRRVVTMQEMTSVSDDPSDPEQKAARAAATSEVLQAELAYRKAVAQLKRLVGE